MNTKTMKKDFSSIGIRMLISTAVITLLQLVAQTFALTSLRAGFPDFLCPDAE